MVGPEDGAEVFGWRLVPKVERSGDAAHVGHGPATCSTPRYADSDTPIWVAVLGYGWYTFRLALVGLLLGGDRRHRARRRDGAVQGRSSEACCRM